MKRVLSALFLAALLSVPARAVPPTQVSVETLATLTQVEKLHEAMIENLQQTFDAYVKQALRGEPMTPADRAVVDAFRPKMLELVNGGLSGSDIKKMYEQVYIESYTQEEVDSLIAFYSSPLGRQIAVAQLQIPFKISTKMQQPMSRMGGPLQMAIFSAVKKIAQAHAPKPPAPAKAMAPVPAKPAAAPAPTAAAPKTN